MKRAQHRRDAVAIRTLWLIPIAVVLACSESAAPVVEPPDPDPPDHLVLVNQDYLSTLYVARNDRFANLVVTESIYEDYRTGNWRLLAAHQVSERTIGTGSMLPDSFDFLIVTFDPDRPREDAPSGAYSRVRNIVDGLGYPQADVAAGFGALHRLLGVIMLRRHGSLRNGPSLHELAHQWGATLSPAMDAGHWGLSGVGGQLGGWVTGSLEELSPGVYRGSGPTGAPFHTIANGGNRVPYAPLELYMMGFLSPDSVPSFEVAEAGEVLDALGGTFTAEAIDTMSMDEILGSFGRRIPSHVDAPKRYRVLYVVISTTALTETATAEIAHDIDEFTRAGPDDRDDVFNFWEATGGRATLQFDGVLATLRD